MKRLVLFALVLSGIIFFIGCQPAEITSAKVYLQQKNNSAALEQLKKATEKYPTNAYAFNLKGQIYGDMDSLEQMDKAFDKAVELDPKYKQEIEKWRKSKSSEAFNKGLRASQKDKHEDALAWYKTSVVADPDNPNAWKNIGYTYAKLNNETESRKAYEKALELDPKDESIALEVIRFYIAEKNETGYNNALKLLRKALEHNPKSSLLELEAGEVFSALGKHDSAIFHMEKAAELDPQNPAIYFNIGATCYNAEDYANAAKYLEMYITKAPDDTNCYVNLISALSLSERFADGIKIAKLMTDRFPGVADGWEQYAIMLARGSDSKEDKLLGVAAISIANAIRKIESGDADGAVKELKDAKSIESVKSRLNDIVKQTSGKEEVKQAVISKL